MKILSILLISLLPVFLFSQNTLIRNGSNGSAVALEAGLGSDGLVSITGMAAFSIGGVLDLGLGFGNTYSGRSGVDATDTAFGLVYNILPIRYSLSIVDLIGNIRGTYNYVIVDSDYIDSIGGTMEGQGFSIAAEAIIDVSPLAFLTFRAGYRGEYSSRLFTTIGIMDETEIQTSERERDNEKGFLAGILLRYKEFPGLSYELLFMNSSRHGDYLKHRISLLVIGD